MLKEEFKTKTKIIKDIFKDDRPIKCQTPEHIRAVDDNIYRGGDIFTTENGDFIDFEYQLTDFDEEELEKYIGLAENLYEKHQKHVSIYLLCHKNIKITVKEHKISSKAEFTIKLSCNQYDPCHMILKNIKGKISKNYLLDAEDYKMIELLPVMCEINDVSYFRAESLKIINGH